MISKLNYVRTFLWDLLFPSLCLGCFREGEVLCSTCLGDLAARRSPPACFGCGRLIPEKERIPPGRTCESCRDESNIFAFLSPLNYEDRLVRELVHSLKYQRLRMIGPILGEVLFDYVKFWGVRFDYGSIVLAVPLHSRRERVRGFNQSQLIAEGFSRKLGMEFKTGVLKRVKKTKPQTGLDSQERRKNVLDAFEAVRPELVRGKTIILVDDVKTTGATLEEAVRVLKDAGARRIWAVTVAH